MAEQEIRTKFIDYDARRRPRTNRCCVKCQLDLSPHKSVRRVFVTKGMHAVYPADILRYAAQEGDPGWLLIGNGCAKIFGLEWSLPTEESKD